MSLPNNPARLDRLARAVALIQADRAGSVHPQYTLDALEDLGAVCRWSGGRWRLFYAGVTGSHPDWSGRAILDSWEKAARRALAPANSSPAKPQPRQTRRQPEPA